DFQVEKEDTVDNICSSSSGPPTVKTPIFTKEEKINIAFFARLGQYGPKGYCGRFG
ncbi:hypothetical protein A2U01_0089281, partial [Trifolium medium]|nr:hypothetical protein [Trifolium medium]